ncbi:MAG TPA: hypothetical protein VF516_43295 [Kofleriaceae bacterium]
MKKASNKHLVLKRDTLKALTELPNTAYRHVVGGAAPRQQPTGCHNDCAGSAQTAGGPSQQDQ